MRNAKKSRQKKESRDNRIKLSNNQVIDLVNTGADVIKSGFDLFKEIEKTKQIAIEAQVRITESNNRLTAELAEFEKDMLKIQREYELEFKRLDNDFKLKMRYLDLVEKMIEKIDTLEITINIYQDKEGMTSTYVMTLFEQLHQEKLTYINALATLGNN